MSALTIDEAQLRSLTQRCIDDFPFFARTCLKIRSKSGEVLPFKLNRAQLHFHERLERQEQKTGKVRAIVLKGRQQGISTYLQGRYYWRLWKAKKGTALNAFILTHEQDATDNLFGMAQRFHDLMPGHLRPPTKAANAKELAFADNGCGYQVATAGGKEVGRSTTVQLFHGCLSPDTAIVDGRTDALRPMGSFIPGDMVRTHRGRLAPISAISSQKKEAFRVTLKGLRDFPLDGTSEHRFWTEGGWKQLGDLSVGERLAFPIRPIADLSVIWPFRLPDSVRPQGGGTRECGPAEIRPSYELGRVVGLYLAEGSIGQQSSGAPSSVCFSVHEREVARTLEWLEPLQYLFRSPPKPMAHKDSKTVAVAVYGRSFASFILGLCGGKDDKRLPINWNGCGKGFARGIAHGYLAGDGHSSSRPGDRRIRATSVRPALTVGMRDALASLGYGWAGIEFRAGALRSGRNERDAWTLALCGLGVDRLVAELGWKMPPRKRTGNYTSIAIDDGYAWVPITAIEPLGVREVMDFEIDHPDHSYCTVHCGTHNSEVGFWPNAESHITSLLSTALADVPGTESVLESTANGIGNVFHRYWQAAVRGHSEYEAIFIPWFWDEGYQTPCPETFDPSQEWLEYAKLHGLTWEQLYWAFLKNRTLAQAKSLPENAPCPDFRQEYPATAEEAFQSSGNSFIPANSVLRARKPMEVILGRGPIILGVDPARSQDKVGIIDRCGRRMGERICERMDPGGNLIYVAGQIARIIDRIRPDAVNIDVGGNGAGVYDALDEMGYSYCLNAVNFGSKPLGCGPTGDRLYLNRRAEMHDELREWFETEGGVQIPDDDGLHADLTAAEWGSGATRYNTANQLIIEEKQHIKDRLGASPDLGDAAALCFAVPFAAGMVAQNQPPPQRKRRTRTGY